MKIMFELGAGSSHTLLKLDEFNSDPAFREWRDIGPRNTPHQKIMFGRGLGKLNSASSSDRLIQTQQAALGWRPVVVGAAGGVAQWREVVRLVNVSSSLVLRR
jgi:hypothetical protein